METFYFEVTDTFGGECNYSWIRRYTVKAKNLKGALIKLSRYIGLNFRNNGIHYKARGECIAAYTLDYEVHADWIEKSEKL